MNKIFSQGLQLFCIVVALSSVGCSDRRKDPHPLYSMVGVVTLDGQPLADATVTHLPEVGPSAGAITDSNGRYEMTNRSGKKGVVAGPGTILISTVITDESGNTTPERLPAKYNSKSTLQVDVKSEPNEIHFDLQSK